MMGLSGMMIELRQPETNEVSVIKTKWAAVFFEMTGDKVWRAM